MHPTECPLQQRGSEDFFDSLVAVVSRTESVAVPNHTGQAIEFADNGVAVEKNPQLFFKVTIRPQVVVSGVVMDRYSAVSNACYGAKQARAAFGNGVFVFVPKVEDVSDQVNFGRRSFLCVVAAHGGVLKPADKTQLALAASGCIGGTEVQVRGEVNAVQGGGLTKQFVQFCS